ncbi:MAG: hypothetical protein IJX92_02285 [Clostridia bacterium]|nr:hypothetical protein [Clostridia bacterium]
MKMSKRIFGLILAVIMLIGALASCAPSDESGDGGENISGDYIYKSGSSLNVVCSQYELDRADTKVKYNSITNQLFSSIGGNSAISVKKTADTSVIAEHELVIGVSEREISKIAYEQLAKISLDEYESAFLVYSDGKSVAIAYNEDEDYVTPEKAIDYFVSNYIDGRKYLTLDAGVVTAQKIKLNEYYQERDDAMVEAQWDSVLKKVTSEMEPTLGEEGAEEYAKELVAALRKFYSMYSDKLISWLANLLDPRICVCEGDVCQNTRYCGGAAFYYSNSARNTKGFLPDAESTAQALGILKNSGMLRLVNNDYAAAFTEELPARFIRFAKALQDEESGYFYHPQWNKEELSVARLSRDMNYATSVLKYFGSLPTYKTPNGDDYDGITYDGKDLNNEVAPTASLLTTRLSTSRVSMVSKVVATAGEAAYPARMENDIEWKKHLATLDLRNNSYSVGNSLAASAKQLVTRQEQLDKQGVSYNLIDITVDWFKANQNKQTGTWYFVNPESPSYDPYYGNDGVLKISAWFNDVGRLFPNASLAAQNAIDAIMSDQDIAHVCNLYNTWFTISNLKSNVRNYGTASDADKFIADLRAVAPEGVLKSLEKIADHQKPDGSFSYYQDHCSQTSQGMPVALADTNEGDLNATSIATYGITGFMFSALDIGSSVDIYTDSDRMAFLAEVRLLDSVIKDEEINNAEPNTFDQYTVGTTPDTSDVGRNIGNKEVSSITVVEDPREKAEGNILSFASGKGSYDYVSFMSKTGLGGSTYVFDADMCVSHSDTTGYIVQINFGTGTAQGNIYMVTLRIREVDGKWVVGIYDSSSTDDNRSVNKHLADVPYQEWFNLKIEYYRINTETSEDMRAKIFVNDECVAVTNNYFDFQGNKITGESKPSVTYNRVWINTMSTRETTLLLDNVAVYKDRRAYIAEKLPIESNVDGVGNEQKTYDFESSPSLPEGFIASEDGGAYLASVIENNISNNKIIVNGGTILMPSNIRSPRANRGSLNMNITVNAEKTGDCGSIAFVDTETGENIIFRLDMKVIDVDGVKYVELYECPAGTTAGAIENARFKLGEEVNLRIDFYHKEDVALIYIGGTFVNACEAIFNNASRLSYSAAMLTMNNKSVAMIDNVTTDFDSFDFTEAEGVKADGNPNTDSFTGGVTGAVIGGNAEGYDDAGDGVIKLSKKNDFVKLIASDRSAIAGASILEVDIEIKDASYIGNILRAAVTDKDGNAIFAIALVATKDGINIHEICSGDKIYPFVLSTIDWYNRSFTLRIEYYEKNQSANIYVSGTGVATTAVTYDVNSAAREVAYSEIKMLGDCEIYVDNMLSDKIFLSQTVIADNSGSNVEDSITEKMTLDYSVNGNIPKAITGSYTTFGAGVSIQQMLKVIGDYQEYSKVGKFVTSSGGNDSLIIKSNNTSTELNNAEMMVFEAELCLDPSTTGTIYQVIFGDSTKGLVTDAAYMFCINVSSGRVQIYDASCTSGSNWRKGETLSIADVGEWFKLRIEYYKGDGTEDGVRIKTFVNDELLYVSDNYFRDYTKATTPKTYFNIVRFYSQGSSVADLYFDNVALYVSEGTCNDEPTLKYTYGSAVPEENKR